MAMITWPTTYKVSQIVGILAVGGTILGMDIASISLFLGEEYFKEYFGYPGPLLQGLITGANPVGGFIGCICFGGLTEQVGRVSTFQIVALVWILGSVISASVLNLAMLIAGRLVRGVAVGILSVLLPVYIGEVIPINKKGAATSVVQLALTVSILIIFFMCFLLNNLESQLSFRVAWGLELVPGLVFFLLTFSLAESPKWLVSQGQYNRAQNVYRNFSAVSFSGTADATKMDVLDMCGPDQKTKYSDLFSNSLLKLTMIGITVQMLVQLCGINIIMFYIVFICEMIGLRGAGKLSAASAPYLINVVFTCIPILTLDRLRRKLVLAYGGISLACTMTLIGITMGALGHGVTPSNGNDTVVWEVTGTPGFVILALCFLSVAVFSSTISCCAWLYTNEVFPARAKCKGMAFCMATSWILNSSLTFTTPLLLSKIKWITFVILGSVTAILSLVVAIWFPETKKLLNDAPRIDSSPCEESIEGKESRSAAPSPADTDNNGIQLIADPQYEDIV
ncbi:LADA_0C11694g1_1 [Lachancea dasiensis]|uniref:LADA_0C11694g1_1 n=1 Tax=Lachancea dasiensis TaxID=1072105 RepID=A0A1G4J1Q5_9SACH|nr:LADA_0C11694g1_1 [Lachancea dasiensis]